MICQEASLLGALVYVTQHQEGQGGSETDTFQTCFPSYSVCILAGIHRTHPNALPKASAVRLEVAVASHRVKQWQENISTITCPSVTERRELAKYVQHTSKEVSMGPVGRLWGNVLEKICGMQNNFNRYKLESNQDLHSLPITGYPRLPLSYFAISFS